MTIKRIRRSNIWLSVLVTLIMFVTFINLVLVNGILVGLIEGSKKDNREQYTSDIFISPKQDEKHIRNSNEIIKYLASYDEVLAYSSRVVSGGLIEANYKNRSDQTQKRNELVVSVVGIRPKMENLTTKLSNFVIEGEYLDDEEGNGILIGTTLLDRYARGFEDSNLKNVFPGSKVRLLINEKYHEMEVRGIVKSKVTNVGSRIFMNQNYLRKLLGSPDTNLDEIAVKLVSDTNPIMIKDSLNKEFSNDAEIKLSEEALGAFFEDIRLTFQLLGNLIGGVAIFVACITIYIITFINAITRRRYIGILKGIGICDLTIKISYTIQALIYALIGGTLGLILTYFIILPYVDKNPIDFPFSDGILSVPLEMTFLRFTFLIAVTALAGYYPSKIIVKKNTLDSILGRK